MRNIEVVVPRGFRELTAIAQVALDVPGSSEVEVVSVLRDYPAFALVCLAVRFPRRERKSSKRSCRALAASRSQLPAARVGLERSSAPAHAGSVRSPRRDRRLKHVSIEHTRRVVLHGHSRAGAARSVG